MQMYLVKLCAICEHGETGATRPFSVVFGFQDEDHFSRYEDTQFDELIESFNRKLPSGWQVDDVIEPEARLDSATDYVLVV